MLDSNSKTVHQVLNADLLLADRGDSCWSAHVSQAFNGMRNGDAFQQKMLSVSKIPKQDFVGDL
eukprot:scaffold270422_cov24-Tisochrysis_lutea.AAC.1